MPLLDAFRDTVRRQPHCPAFIFENRALSYRQFHAIVCVVAKRLHEAGIRPGQTIGLSMGQTPLHCAAMLALGRLGALSVPLWPGQDAAMRQTLCRRYRLDMIVSSWDAQPGDEVPTLKLDGVTLRGDESDLDFIDYQPDADTPLRVALTSGTTGEAKGVLHTHGYFLMRIQRTSFQNGADTRLFAPDLHITLSMLVVMGVLCAGGVVVFPTSYRQQDVVQSLQLYAVSHLIVIPAHAALLAAALPEEGGIAFPSLRHLRLVGAMPPPPLIEALRRKCSPHIYVPYSITEVGVLTMATPEMVARDPLCAGMVQPWARLEAVDEAGHTLPPGTVGELRMQVEGMPTGYYGEVASPAGKFRDGWFYPGDRGRIDASGLLYVEGRVDDILNVGGNKVQPEHIENVIAQFPGVRESVAFLQGDVLMAALLTQGDVDLVALERFCFERLELFCPARFVVVRDLPRNASGKVLRRQMAGFVSAT